MAPRKRKAANPDNVMLQHNADLGGDAAGSHLTLDPADVDDVTLAKKTLRDQMVSTEAPAAAKVQAARTLLELVGALGRNSKPVADATKPVSEMTRAELEAELAGG